MDDEPYVLKSLRFILELEGYQVCTANDGLEALEKLNTEKPDLLLLDMVMPHMSGQELSQKIKTDPATKDLYIIMLTARGQERDKTLAIQSGADEHMTKPFKPSLLVQRIKEILGS